MRYYALACDYDGTLAHDGAVDAATIDALKRLRESGRRLLMVTGREVGDLCQVLPDVSLFEWVVAENGAVLYNPRTRESRLLAEPPPPEFVARLRAQGVEPLSVGDVIVATREPHETTALAAIRDLGLEHQVVFNKGAVMVLPAGINKASGLRAALDIMRLSPHNVVGVGDAENDHAFLSICECGVAVANALASIKEQADWVTDGARGAGVVQLIDRLLVDDLASIGPRLARHAIPIAEGDRADLALEPYGVNVMLAGTSGGGKSTLASGVLERLTERGYQYCIIDPEGDYENVGEVVVGDAGQPPNIEAVIQLLDDPRNNAVINLLGVALADRPVFFQSLLPALVDLRARTGRPHWLVIDEVHHLLPDRHESARESWPTALKGLLMITVHPDHVLRPLLAGVDWLWVIGAAPGDTLKRFGRGAGVEVPDVKQPDLKSGELLLWPRHRQHQAPARARSIPPRTERKRHHRKYAEGELAPELSFYFRGPKGKLNLRAQNLSIFVQSADGVDDETWLFHLRRGDYSRWFRDVIKDKELAAAVAKLEHEPQPSPKQTRQFVRQQIEKRYTAPA